MGCVIMQPYDYEVGAGTFHTATTLRSLVPLRGKLHMRSRAVDPPTVVTAKTLTVCSIIISSRFC